MAAKWLWQSDQGWIVYAPAVSAVIEAGFQKKEKRVKVDPERFVDLVDMFQRRYDDESKRRAVKRDFDPNAAPAPPPAPKFPLVFKKEIFYILASSAKKKDKLSEDAANHGALIAEHFTAPKVGKNSITHVICSEADIGSFLPVLDSMVKSGVEIVTPEFVMDSIVEEDLQEAAKYRLSVKKNAPDYAIALQKMDGTKFVPYPFELQVQEVKGDKFSGFAYWPTLGKTKTKVAGNVNGTNVTFEEMDYMEGDGVELNNKYTATLSAVGLAGTFVDNIGLHGQFELKPSK